MRQSHCFSGSNCDRDMVCALNLAGHEVIPVWHKETERKNIDLVAIPGGFSFGDYLRCGVTFLKAIFKEVLKHIGRGGYALGVCNSFQILTEAEFYLALQQNVNTKFISKTVDLHVLNTTSIFTHRYIPTDLFLYQSHHEGNYFAHKEDLKKLKDGVVLL